MPSPQADPALPYWRLSGFYLVYFASLGALIPYWGIYLQSLGFSPLQIGQLIGVIMVTKVVAPNLWGWLADRHGKRMGIVRLASLISALAFAGVFLDDGFWWLMLVITVFSFFWNASLPQFEATTMNYLGAAHHRYSLVRLWGSLGFVLSVALLGEALDRYGEGLIPAVILSLFVAIWLSSLSVAEGPPPKQHGEQRSLRQILRQPAVIALLGGSLLLQISHGPYYAFFSIYMEENGYSHTVIGLLWAVGVIAEVLLFLVMGRLLHRFGTRKLWTAALLLTALRWLLTALYPQHGWVMLLSQTLHAASFGVCHAIAIHLVHHFFSGPHQGRGQALYSSLSFGVGGALGSVGAGWIWAMPGGQALTFKLAATAALLAAVWSWIGLRDYGPGSANPR